MRFSSTCMLAQRLVEGAERLVEQNDVRFEDESTGKRHALLLPAGEFGGHAPFETLKPDLGQCLAATALLVLLGDAAHAQRKSHIVGDRHVREERIVLKDHADIALVRRQVVDRAFAEADLAACRVLEAGDHHQRRRLAGAGGAEEGDELAGLDVERNVVGSHMPAVIGLGDVAKGEGTGNHGYAPKSGCRGGRLGCAVAVGLAQRARAAAHELRREPDADAGENEQE